MRSAKNTKITDFFFLSGMTLAGSRSVVSDAHIQTFTYFTAPELSRPRSVARRARVQAFAILLVLKLSRSRSVARRAQSQSLQDCASFVSSSRNSNKMTFRSSLHAQSPSMSTRPKQKRKVGRKGRLNHRTKPKICKCKKMSQVRIFALRLQLFTNITVDTNSKKDM